MASPAADGPILPSGLRLGIDLDLTLVDTRAATMAALRDVDRTLARAVDLHACLASPAALRAEVAKHRPPDEVTTFFARFVTAFARVGTEHLTALPGASALVAELRGSGGRSIVITARRADTARMCLHACGLTVDVLEAQRDAGGKTAAILRHDVHAYLGDQPADMSAARAALRPGIGVLTGASSSSALRASGADTVIRSLHEVAQAVTSLGLPTRGAVPGHDESGGRMAAREAQQVLLSTLRSRCDDEVGGRRGP